MTLSALQSTLVAAFLLLLMFGMGATLSRERFATVVAAPRPLLIGLVSQFLWMPFAAFVIARALELPDAVAIGLVIMGCSTGGTSSNFFTWFARADLALSISMTVTSTVVGVVAIPLVLSIWTRPFTRPDLEIPYTSIVTTLVAVIVPVALGVWLRSRSVLWASRAERFGGLCGWGVLALVILGGVIRDADILLSIPPEVYLAATLLGPLGFGLGWIGARLLSLDTPQRRAVCLETGIQNAPLALAVVTLSFPADQAPEVLVAPLLYGVLVVPCSAVVAYAFRRSPTA
ncbi:MAG: bile acid:sodium symporter [bacterium]|nr:bile acid:sodium symporter [bacterium]